MTEKPGKPKRRVYGRPRLNGSGKLTDEAIEEFAREVYKEMRRSFWDETSEDSGRIDPNKNPDDFEVPPPDYELMTYDELVEEAKNRKTRKGRLT